MTTASTTHPAALDAAARDAVRALGSTRVALAESCTGGLASAAITRVPGSSACFVAGVAAYANEAKTALLGVAPDLLARHGAVSEAVVRAMAQGLLERCEVTLAGALSGVAGPGGGSEFKPVGTVWFALAGRGNTEAWTVRFSGDRDAIRAQAAASLLRRLAGAA